MDPYPNRVYVCVCIHIVLEVEPYLAMQCRSHSPNDLQPELCAVCKLTVTWDYLMRKNTASIQFHHSKSNTSLPIIDSSVSLRRPTFEAMAYYDRERRGLVDNLKLFRVRDKRRF